MARVWIVGSEALDASNLPLLAREMERRGHEVVVIASEVMATKLHEVNLKEMVAGRQPLPFLCDWSEEGLSRAFGSPALILTGIALRPGYGLGLVNSGHLQTEALEDSIIHCLLPPDISRRVTVTVSLQAGYSGKPYYGAEGHLPDFFLVNDEAAKRIVEKGCPTMTSKRVKIIGNPHFDTLAETKRNLPEAARRAREKLGISDDLPIIIYAGSVCATLEHFQLFSEGRGLEMVVKAANALKADGHQFHLIIRPHPRFLNDPGRLVPGEKEAWDMARARLSFQPVDSSKLETAEVLAAANVVVAQPGSIITEAAVLGKDIIALGGDALARYYKQWQTDTLPPLELGCCAAAGDTDKLAISLSAALFGGLGLGPAQAAAFKTDGRNTERVCDFLESLLQ